MCVTGSDGWGFVHGYHFDMGTTLYLFEMFVAIGLFAFLPMAILFSVFGREKKRFNYFNEMCWIIFGYVMGTGIGSRLESIVPLLIAVIVTPFGLIVARYRRRKPESE